MRISAPQASSYVDADSDWHARQNHILGIDDDEDDDEDEDEEEEEDEDEEEEAPPSHVTPRKQRKCCPWSLQWQLFCLASENCRQNFSALAGRPGL